MRLRPPGSFLELHIMDAKRFPIRMARNMQLLPSVQACDSCSSVVSGCGTAVDHESGLLTWQRRVLALFMLWTVGLSSCLSVAVALKTRGSHHGAEVLTRTRCAGPFECATVVGALRAGSSKDAFSVYIAAYSSKQFRSLCVCRTPHILAQERPAAHHLCPTLLSVRSL